jgi:hypothetical protein
VLSRFEVSIAALEGVDEVGGAGEATMALSFVPIAHNLRMGRIAAQQGSEPPEVYTALP